MQLEATLNQAHAFPFAQHVLVPEGKPTLCRRGEMPWAFKFFSNNNTHTKVIEARVSRADCCVLQAPLTADRWLSYACTWLVPYRGLEVMWVALWMRLWPCRQHAYKSVRRSMRCKK